MKCPQCEASLDLDRHGYLIFDGQVWCDRCRSYDGELLRPRDFQEIKAWSRMICENFGFAPVHLEENPDPAIFRREASVLMAEADRQQRSICFYPPGCRLTTLCHELAHVYTGQDHTREWAGTFAELVAWVKSYLVEDKGLEGFRPRLSIDAGWPQKVY